MLSGHDSMPMKTLFKGAGVAMVTPFNQDKSINYDELTRLIEYQLAQGTDAIVVCGTTGEPSTMTKEERMQVIKHAMRVVKRRVPVIAGCGVNNTNETVEMAKRIEELGVDGLLIVTPYYNKATQNGLYEHYKSIAKAVALPIIMYNVPSRTGVNLLPATAEKLGREFDNIVAVKEASGNISQVAELISRTKDCLQVYSGNDDQIIPILSLGGVGVISVLSNIAPKDTHDMVMEYLEGNREYARKLQLGYLELIRVLFMEVNPIPIKRALEYMGYEAMHLRLPLTRMEDAHASQLEKEMQKIHLQ